MVCLSTHSRTSWCRPLEARRCGGLEVCDNSACTLSASAYRKHGEHEAQASFITTLPECRSCSGYCGFSKMPEDVARLVNMKANKRQSWRSFTIMTRDSDDHNSPPQQDTNMQMYAIDPEASGYLCIPMLPALHVAFGRSSVRRAEAIYYCRGSISSIRTCTAVDCRAQWCVIRCLMYKFANLSVWLRIH